MRGLCISYLLNFHALTSRCRNLPSAPPTLVSQLDVIFHSMRYNDLRHCYMALCSSVVSVLSPSFLDDSRENRLCTMNALMKVCIRFIWSIVVFF